MSGSSITKHLIFATLVCFGLSWSTSAWSQVPDLASVNVQYLPSTPLNDPEPVGVQVASYDATLNVPIVLGETSFLIPGVSGHTDSISFQKAPSDFIQLSAFHSAEVGLLYVQLLPKNWSIAARVATGLAGDFEAVDSGMIRSNGMLMASRGFGKHTVIGLGALGGYSFGRFLPLPALYMSWENDKWSIETFLPAFLEAKFKANDRLELGVASDVQGNEYAVRDRRIVDSYPCVAGDSGPAQPENCLDHVAYSVVTAGPQVNLRLVGTLWVSTLVGTTLYRRIDIYNKDHVRVFDGTQELSQTWFVRVGLTWRLPQGPDDDD